MKYERIEDLVHAYSDAVTRQDTPQLHGTWEDDALWELQPGQPVEGIDAIVGLFEAAIHSLHHVIQVVYNGAYRIDDSGALEKVQQYEVGKGPIWVETLSILE